MAEWEASAEELINAGWGSHLRQSIPEDWRTRRGPDSKTWAPHREPRQKRQTFRQRRAMFEAAQESAK